MGLKELIFGKDSDVVGASYFRPFTAYQPVFSNWGGQLYESELVRASIDARARHISKLRIEFTGNAKPKLQSRLKQKPNNFMTWAQFLYRLSTILDMQNNAFICPIRGEYGEVVGIYPLLPSRCEIVKSGGELYVRYKFSNGDTGAVNLMETGIMTKFQYKNDFFGESNFALQETMQLIAIQSQGIEEAVKNSNTFRFMAKINNFAKASDIAKERKRFTEQNLSAESEAGGILLFPNNYEDIRQITSQPYTVAPEQMQMIQTRISNYFGVNELILQNKATGDDWSAFYEGAVEPFSIQLSEVLTKMLFTEREIAQGTEAVATANRLQYLSNQDKLAVSSQMADRGIMTINEIRQIWNLAPVEGGDIFIMRGEYKNSNDVQEDGNE